MRVLGVNGTTGALYFAVADDGVVVAGVTERVQVPNEMKLTSNLETVRQEIDLALGEIKPDRIAIVQGGTAPGSYNKGVARQGAETVLRLCALDRDIAAEIVTRQKVATRLGISGSLPDNLGQVLAQSGQYWTAGRSLAVATAVGMSKPA